MKICTIGSHSALQILKGAQDEGFYTIVICMKGREQVYKLFNVANEIIIIDSYKDLAGIENSLIKRDAVIIPHASFIEYVGLENVVDFKVPYFGNKNVLKWESNRDLQREWLLQSKLMVPKIIKNPANIDCSVIVKFHGAKGGMGYFVANSEEDFRKKIAMHMDEKYIIQEYIIGVPCYIHYFYSSLTDELEIMGFDKRYESNVDSLGRISSRDQMALERIDPSYVVVGNVPIVLRESLLPKVLEMGRSVVEVSKKIMPHGLYGPFCLETIITPEQDFYVFEISARIVAGTNPYVDGSPYTALKYNTPMSTGRRIAREIRLAIERGQLNKVLQ